MHELSLFLSDHFTFVYHGSLQSGCIDLFQLFIIILFLAININIIIIIKNAQRRRLPGVVDLINTKCSNCYPWPACHIEYKHVSALTTNKDKAISLCLCGIVKHENHLVVMFCTFAMNVGTVCNQSFWEDYSSCTNTRQQLVVFPSPWLSILFLLYHRKQNLAHINCDGRVGIIVNAR